MGSTQAMISVLLLLVALAIVHARPSCTTYAEKDVVCTSGDEDFILERGLVSDNNKTTGITLRDCRITDINYEAFQNTFSLKYIDLSRNKISYLKLGVLDGSHEVTYLNLSYNLLQEFPLGLFDQKPNLDLLDLKGNNIHKLQQDIFNPLRKLKYLDLSSNVLLGRNLNPNMFDNSHRIEFMDFSRNDMSGTPDNLLNSFEALNFLNLDRCSLTEVPNFAVKSNLKSMKHLMLTTNRIRTLDNPNMFAALENLEIINFAGNIIEHVNEHVFKANNKLTMVILTYNKLKNIPDTLFQSLPKLTSIDLSHNLIGYVPVNGFRSTGLKELNLAFNKLTYLTDNFCLELRNSGVMLVSLNFAQNPWQCACLNDILKEVKKFGISYNKSKFNGREPVCVTKEFNCKRQQSVNDYFVEMYDNIIKINKPWFSS